MANPLDALVRIGEVIIGAILKVSPRIAVGFLSMAFGALVTIMMEEFVPETRHIEIWLAMSMAVGAFGMLSILFGLAQNVGSNDD